MLTGLTTASKQTWTFNFQNRVLFQRVGEEVNDLETQVDAQLVERLDMEALPSGSKQVKTKTWKVAEENKSLCRSPLWPMWLRRSRMTGRAR